MTVCQHDKHLKCFTNTNAALTEMGQEGKPHFAISLPLIPKYLHVTRVSLKQITLMTDERTLTT